MPKLSWAIFFSLIYCGCGIKGRPLPPEHPPEIGTGVYSKRIEPAVDLRKPKENKEQKNKTNKFIESEFTSQ